MLLATSVVKLEQLVRLTTTISVILVVRVTGLFSGIERRVFLFSAMDAPYTVRYAFCNTTASREQLCTNALSVGCFSSYLC